jgi:protein-S-isoprenylcysteine O-methyltransferase Ste14
MSSAAILAWYLIPALAIGGTLFTSAGRFDVPAVWWAYLGMWLLVSVVGALGADPALLQERLRPGPGARESLPLAALIAGALTASHFVIAGLDVGRFHWSDSVPAALEWAGLVTFAASLAIAQWASSENRFFSSVVRIQSERGHHVITSGPYAYVRHPGYAGAIGAALSSALALGSWLSILPSLLAGALLVRRISREERVLRKELPGYASYQQRVGYRLVPGLW